MNEEPGATAVMPPPPPEAAPEQPKRTWRKGFDLVRKNPVATMLPLTVIQLPLGIAGAVAYFFLYYEAYPNVDFQSFSRLEDSPGGLLLALVLMTAVYLLFSMVGVAATIVAANTLLQGKPVKLAESLDPAFTRMGGLLILGAMFYLFMLASAAGIILLIYFILRWGLAVHSYVLDGTSIGGSLGMSWRTLRGNMLRFIGLLVTGVLVGMVTLTVAAIVAALLLAPFSADPGRTATLVAQSLGFLIFAIAVIPTAAYLGAATTIFYVSAKEKAGA